MLFTSRLPPASRREPRFVGRCKFVEAIEFNCLCRNCLCVSNIPPGKDLTSHIPRFCTDILWALLGSKRATEPDSPIANRHLLHFMTSSPQPPLYYGITVKHVTVKRNGTIEDPPDRITLHGHKNSDFSFNATFPECEWIQTALETSLLTFQYDSEENCTMQMRRDRDGFSVFVNGSNKNSGFATLNGMVRFINHLDRPLVMYGNEIGNYTNDACPPRFKNDKLFFQVLEVRGECNFTLDFGKYPLSPGIVATTFESVTSTTVAPTGLSRVAFWLLVTGGPVVGVLLLIGLGAFLYWFFIYRKRRARRPKKKFSEEKQALEIDSLEQLFLLDEMWEPRPWEAKLRNGDQLNAEEYLEKETYEADWRWIHRRNRAYDAKEPYPVDPAAEAYKKKLMDDGNFKKLRELESYVPRPELYKRRNDEKQAAVERYKYRVRGMPPPPYEELGCQVAEDEHDIRRPYPKPMDEDWIASSDRYTSAGSAGE
ncbi:hypothetical protein DdX_18464 [Ditylenchus destructor]|uniref:Uncharacterized protein n=1 Tax=Ditylenchus destructor TaxID=166010 RepID=A0AAD4MK66_9BILA|nr:hypothetical protein DdX_18464 [Ditylenchus destructor]